MAQQKVVYACDIGGSKLLCGFVTEAGEIIDTEKTPLPASSFSSPQPAKMPIQSTVQRINATIRFIVISPFCN